MNTVVVLITKNICRVHEPTQRLVDLTTPEGRQSGIRGNSAVVCDNLFTVSKTKILHRVGTLPPLLVQKVDGCLKTALNLP
jgi:mRNA-degrading endonuclease toxin of MazEF toxin-antitoxin module